jgi:hypothetical protein
MGSLYTPNTKDAEGKPLVTKTGPNAGQARTNFFFALAIPKTPGLQHWAHEAWGRQIWEVGCACFPQASQSPSFAWKIEDGDSQVPNKKGRKPIDNEGWRGNWILKFSGGFAPKVYRAEGSGWVQIIEENYVKCGYFAQVAFSVDGNESQSQPGVYLNHQMVCFSAYGPEIVFGPDVNEAGFGNAPLPPGASLTPVASAAPMPAAPPQNNPYSPAPGAPPALPAVPVTPNPAFLQVPPPAATQAAPPVVTATYAAPPAPPALPPAPVAAAPSNGPQMTAKAGGVTREAYLAAGWTDAQLIQNGYMTV